MYNQYLNPNFCLEENSSNGSTRPPETTPPPTECGGIISGLSGTIQSPGFPEFFPPDSSCEWIIDCLENRIDSKDLYYGQAKFSVVWDSLTMNIDWNPADTIACR